jgi:hypothetical protein
MWVESSKAFGVYPSPAFVFPTIIKANAPNPVQSSQTEKIAFPGCKSQPSSPVSLTRLPRLLFYLRVNPLWNYFYVSGVRELKGEDGKIQQKLFFSVATKVVQIFFLLAKHSVRASNGEEMKGWSRSCWKRCENRLKFALPSSVASFAVSPSDIWYILLRIHVENWEKMRENLIITSSRLVVSETTSLASLCGCVRSRSVCEWEFSSVFAFPPRVQYAVSCEIVSCFTVISSQTRGK